MAFPAHRATGLPILFRNGKAETGNSERVRLPPCALLAATIVWVVQYSRRSVSSAGATFQATRPLHAFPAVLAARLDGRWLILDSRRSELVDDSEATSFAPQFTINGRGVQLFAAPDARISLTAQSRPRPPRQRRITSKNGYVELSNGGGFDFSPPLLL